MITADDVLLVVREILPQAAVDDDLRDSLDSLQMVDLLNRLERRFSVEIAPFEIIYLSEVTARPIADLINSKAER